MSDLWTIATIDHEAEHREHLLTMARLATTEQWGYLSQATTREDFENRRALVAERLDDVVGKIVAPEEFILVRSALEDGYVSDFHTMYEARLQDDQRRNAFRAAERAARARVASETARRVVAKKVADTSGLYPELSDEDRKRIAAEFGQFMADSAGLPPLSDNGLAPNVESFLAWHPDYGDAVRDFLLDRRRAVRHASVTSFKRVSWGIDRIRQILAEKAFGEVDGMIVDINTANVIAKVYDALNPDMQQKALTMPLEQFGSFAWKQVGSKQAGLQARFAAQFQDSSNSLLDGTPDSKVWGDSRGPETDHEAEGDGGKHKGPKDECPLCSGGGKTSMRVRGFLSTRVASLLQAIAFSDDPEYLIGIEDGYNEHAAGKSLPPEFVEQVQERSRGNHNKQVEKEEDEEHKKREKVEDGKKGSRRTATWYLPVRQGDLDEITFREMSGPDEEATLRDRYKSIANIEIEDPVEINPAMVDRWEGLPLDKWDRIKGGIGSFAPTGSKTAGFPDPNNESWWDTYDDGADEDEKSATKEFTQGQWRFKITVKGAFWNMVISSATALDGQGSLAYFGAECPSGEFQDALSDWIPDAEDFIQDPSYHLSVLRPRTAKATYDEWKQAIDDYVQSKVGLSIDDLADVPFMDWYEDGVSPASAARRALRNEGYTGKSKVASACQNPGTWIINDSKDEIRCPSCGAKIAPGETHAYKRTAAEGVARICKNGHTWHGGGFCPTCGEPAAAGKGAARHHADLDSYDMKRAGQGEWVSAGTSFVEAINNIKSLSDPAQSDTLVLLRNNFNGGVTVFQVNPIGSPPYNMGSYERFYGKPYPTTAARIAAARARKTAGDPGRRFWFYVDAKGKDWGPFDDEAKADLGAPSNGSWRELTPEERIEFGATPGVWNPPITGARKVAFEWGMPFEGQPRSTGLVPGGGGKTTVQGFIDFDPATRGNKWWVEVWPKPQYAHLEATGLSATPGMAMAEAERAMSAAISATGPGGGDWSSRISEGARRTAAFPQQEIDNPAEQTFVDDADTEIPEEQEAAGQVETPAGEIEAGHMIVEGEPDATGGVSIMFYEVTEVTPEDDGNILMHLKSDAEEFDIRVPAEQGFQTAPKPGETKPAADATDKKDAPADKPADPAAPADKEKKPNPFAKGSSARPPFVAAQDPDDPAGRIPCQRCGKEAHYLYGDKRWYCPTCGWLGPQKQAAVHEAIDATKMPVHFFCSGDPYLYMNGIIGSVSVETLEQGPDGAWTGVIIVPAEWADEVASLLNDSPLAAAAAYVAAGNPFGGNDPANPYAAPAAGNVPTAQPAGDPAGGAAPAPTMDQTPMTTKPRQMPTAGEPAGSDQINGRM